MKRSKILTALIAVLAVLLALALFACNPGEEEELPEIDFGESLEDFTLNTGFTVSGNTLTQELPRFSDLAAEIKVTYNFFDNITTTAGSTYRLYSDAECTQQVEYFIAEFDETVGIDIPITSTSYQFWIKVFMRGAPSINNVYHVIFTRAPYYIYYQTNSDQILAPTESFFGEKISLPQLARADYAFVGWYSDADLTELFEDEIMAASDLTLYAKWATTESYGDFAYYVSGGKAVLAGVSAAGAGKDELTIPATINGYQISGIAGYAFYDAEFSKITLTEGGLTLGANAFSGVSELTIAVPASARAAYLGNAEWKKWAHFFEGITTDEADGFVYAVNGEEAIITGYNGAGGAVALPQTLGGATVVEIAEFAFKNNTDITRLNLGEAFSAGNLWLQASAFDGTDFTIFAPAAFRTQTNWSKYAARIVDSEIPETALAETADGAYSVNLRLGSATATTVDAVVLSAQKLGESGALNLTGMVLEVGGEELSVIVKAIAPRAFLADTELTSVTLPASVTDIGEEAFRDCSALTAVTPATFVNVGAGAFRNAALLAGSFNITGKSVEPYSFYGTAITAFSAANAEVIGEFALASSKTATFSASNAAVIKSYALSDTRVQSFSAGNKLFEIGDYAFYNTARLTSVTLTDNLISVGSYAFAATSVKNIYIGKNLSVIGSYAFQGVDDLTGVTISAENRLTGIGDYAFSGCSHLKPFPISECSALYSIGNHAFDSAGSGYSTAEVRPRALDIPKTVVYIGDFAFNKNFFYNRLSFFGSGVSALQYIGEKAFFATGLSGTLTIPKNVVEIGDEAFSGLGKITGLMFEEVSALERIGKGAFRNIAAQGMLTLPASLKSIGNYAFNGCKMLTSVSFGRELETLGSNAFSHCTALVSVVFAQGCKLKSINDSAFYFCSYLASFTIPAQTEYIGNSAFKSCKRLETLNTLALVPPRLGLNAFDLTPIGYLRGKIYVPDTSNSLGTPIINSYMMATDGSQGGNTPGYHKDMERWANFASIMFKAS
ncbi:MAG: leucine-rich repeat protein [Christensenellales bacterium]|jgi:uncharacterized repeat protein (TIGR02543 family)